MVTLNEIEGMRAIMPRVKKEWVDQILLLDGGSTDGTLEYAKEQGYDVYIQKQRGLRHAYVEVVPHCKGSVVILFSPDGNSVPELIPDLVAKAKEGYDMVIVSRYLGDAKSEDDGLVTAFGNWMFTSLINVLFGGHYTDTLVIFRAYKTRLIHDLELDKDEFYRLPEKICGTTLCLTPLMGIRAAKRKLKIAEIPGDEPKRLGGQTNLRPFVDGSSILIQIIREIFVWR